jgi:hypothetical protein
LPHVQANGRPEPRGRRLEKDISDVVPRRLQALVSASVVVAVLAQAVQVPTVLSILPNLQF